MILWDSRSLVPRPWNESIVLIKWLTSTWELPLEDWQLIQSTCVDPGMTRKRYAKTQFYKA